MSEETAPAKPSNIEAETKTETYRFRDTVASLLALWETLPKGEQEKTLHYLTCELAEVNRMFGKVYLGDDPDDDPNGALAAMRGCGLEPTIEHVFEEDDPDGVPPTLCVDVHGVSALRAFEFLHWLTEIVEPFGGYVEEAGYADPPGPAAKRPTDH